MLYNTLVVFESTCCTTHWLYEGPHVVQHIGCMGSTCCTTHWMYGSQHVVQQIVCMGVHMLFNTLVVWVSTCCSTILLY